MGEKNGAFGHSRRSSVIKSNKFLNCLWFRNLQEQNYKEKEKDMGWGDRKVKVKQFHWTSE